MDQPWSSWICQTLPDNARYFFCQISVRLWRSSKSWSFNRRCQQGLPKLHSELSDVERGRESGGVWESPHTGHILLRMFRTCHVTAHRDTWSHMAWWSCCIVLREWGYAHRMMNNADECHVMPCPRWSRSWLLSQINWSTLWQMSWQSWHLTAYFSDSWHDSSKTTCRLSYCLDALPSDALVWTCMNYSWLYLFVRIISHDEAAPCFRNVSFERQASCQRQNALDIFEA